VADIIVKDDVSIELESRQSCHPVKDRGLSSAPPRLETAIPTYP